jgi:hypothetical protein
LQKENLATLQAKPVKRSRFEKSESATQKSAIPPYKIV